MFSSYRNQSVDLQSAVIYQVNHSVLNLVTKLNNLTECSILSSLFLYGLLIVRHLPCLLDELCQDSD